MVKHIDTIIVGGGQAGLSISYFLKKQGRDHLILEKESRSAEVWRNRWDSFSLNTPNWMINLPGAEYSGNAPDDFMLRDDLVSYFENYINKYDLPIIFGIKVLSINKKESGFLIRTTRSDFEAEHVVVATGSFQKPKIPAFSANVSSDILQLHSDDYRNPDAIPAGNILVVGSAQSGAQIAEELNQAGRKVYLSVGKAGRLPRRYRGKDITYWMEKIGFFSKTIENISSPEAKFASNPHISGKNGGHTINLYQFNLDGISLLGHIESIQGHQIKIVPDLLESLEIIDKFESKVISETDNYIENNHLQIPVEDLPDLSHVSVIEETTSLDMKSEEINTIIWATGYTFDFSMVKLPVVDQDGFPLQKRGVTSFSGLYFIGMPFLHNLKSGLLAGIGTDAAYLASII